LGDKQTFGFEIEMFWICKGVGKRKGYLAMGLLMSEKWTVIITRSRVLLKIA